MSGLCSLGLSKVSWELKIASEVARVETTRSRDHTCEVEETCEQE